MYVALILVVAEATMRLIPLAGIYLAAKKEQDKTPAVRVSYAV